MEKHKPTCTYFLDKRIQKKSGKYPVKLSVSYLKRKKRYGTNVDLSIDEWEKIHSKGLKDEKLKTEKIKINGIVEKASNAINTITPFCFEKFESMFFFKQEDYKSLKISRLFEDYTSTNEKRLSISTAISYNTTLHSLLNFRKDISILEITPKYLMEYEKRLIGEGKSITTVSIYMRQLRSIFNNAIAKNLVDKENYPFGRHKYLIPACKNIKKALSINEIKSLLSYTPETVEEAKALDFWIFSYLCNGMNFCDIARLKWENLGEKFIYFKRSKTRTTKKDSEQHQKVPLHPRAIEIIQKRGDKMNPDSLIFGILSDKDYNVIALCHPRQADRLGNSSAKWGQLHDHWAKTASR